MLLTASSALLISSAGGSACSEQEGGWCGPAVMIFPPPKLRAFFFSALSLLSPPPRAVVITVMPPATAADPMVKRAEGRAPPPPPPALDATLPARVPASFKCTEGFCVSSLSIFAVGFVETPHHHLPFFSADLQASFTQTHRLVYLQLQTAQGTHLTTAESERGVFRRLGALPLP